MGFQAHRIENFLVGLGWAGPGRSSYNPSVWAWYRSGRGPRGVHRKAFLEALAEELAIHTIRFCSKRTSNFHGSPNLILSGHVNYEFWDLFQNHRSPYTWHDTVASEIKASGPTQDASSMTSSLRLLTTKYKLSSDQWVHARDNITEAPHVASLQWHILWLCGFKNK